MKIELTAAEAANARTALYHAIAQCEMRCRSIQRRRMVDPKTRREWMNEEIDRRDALQLLHDKLSGKAERDNG